MPTHFRHAICQTGTALALVMMSGALSAATAQTVIMTEPVETRTIVREPLNLTPTQRTTVYRTIVPQARGKKPIIKERIVTETMGRAPVRERVVVDPPVRERVVVDPLARERVVTRPTEVEYVVGDRVPASMQLMPFPDRIVREVPATSSYRYMVVNDRLLLVDPVTSTVVEDLRGY